MKTATFYLTIILFLILIFATCWLICRRIKAQVDMSLRSHKLLEFMNNQTDCPAFKHMDASFPPRFFGRVPKTIRMLKTTFPDSIHGLGTVPCYEGLACEYGREFPAWTNSYGAVAAIFPDGRMLGVKPDEFEVVEFFPAEAHKPA